MWKITADNVEIYNNDGIKIFDINEAKQRSEKVEERTMSELTTGGINFGYQSPISQIYKDVEYKFKEDMENKIMEAVYHFEISVDKEELIKALQYDRNQYDKGYSDGRASIVGEFERLRSELHETAEMHIDGDYYLRDEWIDEYIDNHIAELKGENK